MITPIIKVKGGEYAVEADGRLRAVKTYYGKSSDTKPVEGVSDADRFYEKDTKNAFVFDASDKQWWPL